MHYLKWSIFPSGDHLISRVAPSKAKIQSPKAEAQGDLRIFRENTLAVQVSRKRATVNETFNFINGGGRNILDGAIYAALALRAADGKRRARGGFCKRNRCSMIPRP